MWTIWWKKNGLQLPLFFFLLLFFCQPYPGHWNYISVFLILQILQYGGSKWWFQLFPRYPCKISYKNWSLHIYKIYDHQDLQAGTSTGFESNETNQTGAGDVIKARSRDKLKTCLHCQSTYAHHTWQDGNLTWRTPAYKVTVTFWSVGLAWSRDKLKPLYLHYPSPSGYKTWQDGSLPWWAPAYKVTSTFDHVVL